MLFLRRFPSSGVVIEGHDIEGVGSAYRETSHGPPGAQRRGIRGGLEPGRGEGGQRRERQGGANMEELRDTLTVNPW